MKYIFDFDNVIFFTGRARKESMFPILENMGISRQSLEEQYSKSRAEGFSMKNFLKYFSPSKDIYEEVMTKMKDFANKELIEIIKKLGRENCYLVTYGDEEYQREKINRLGVESLFCEIITVPKEDKKEIIENICAKHKDEELLFIDDVQKHFDDLDIKKCPNLKAILYTGQTGKELKTLLLLS